MRTDEDALHVASEYLGGPPVRESLEWKQVLGWCRSEPERGVPAGLTLLTDSPPFFFWLPESAEGSVALISALGRRNVALLSPSELAHRAEERRAAEVERRLEAQFPPDDRAEVRALMARSPALTSARVRLAVLTLGGADRGAIERLVAEAERDWRDVVWVADKRGYSTEAEP